VPDVSQRIRSHWGVFVPIHHAIASRFHLIAGIDSFETALADPELKERLDQFMQSGGAPNLPSVTVSSAQAPGPHGVVPVRIYRPANTVESRPALIWLHGGAFIGGNLDMPEADWVSREICHRAGAVVISVDYRLAVGGVTYPVPHDDAVAAVRWVRDTAGELGIDPDRISVGGASAGGNLAAGAVLRLRDDEDWVPATLILAYSTTHAVVPAPSTSLAALMVEVPQLLRFPPAFTQFITRNYLGGPESGADGYAMPANATLEGLCPVILINAEYDDLRASSEAFAAQLALAAVDVRQVMVRSMMHGFLNHAATIPPVSEALDLMAEAVTRAAVAKSAVSA
jgi:acetyl esterase/lipase